MVQFTSRRAVLKQVFGKWNYVALALSIALLFYFANALILQWSNLRLLDSTEVFRALTLGAYYLIPRLSFSLLLIISVLTGMLVSLMVYKARLSLKASHASNVFTSLGILAGAFVPGCAACGIGLAALLGLGTSLATLPFKGAELSVLAIGLLVFALASVSKNLTNCERCQEASCSLQDKK